MTDRGIGVLIYSACRVVVISCLIHDPVYTYGIYIYEINLINKKQKLISQKKLKLNKRT